MERVLVWRKGGGRGGKGLRRGRMVGHVGDGVQRSAVVEKRGMEIKKEE